MSMGVGARARLADQDNETVIYNYYGYNINFPDYRADNHSYDGYIIIPKSCFVEPEIHQKLKRMPSGKKKLIIKRVPVDVDYEKMVEDGLIEVHNCSNCWRTYKKNIDSMAFGILFQLFYQYQDEGKIPDYVSYLT